MSKHTENELQCFHCGETCETKDIHLEEKYFCCTGCKTVFEILNQNGLCDYYELNNHPGLTKKDNIRQDKYDILDDEIVASKFIRFKDDNFTKVQFYIPQIHCSSCLWLLENLPIINENIYSSVVNFVNKEITISYNHHQISIKELVLLLEQLGYEPYISFENTTVQQSKSFNKKRIYKLGVAGFCFGNIMLFSFPEYFAFNGDIVEQFKNLFRGLNLLLSLPVVFYSATEFFTSAYKGLKNKYLNIDVPLSIAIILTFVRSIYEIAFNIGPGFFDTLSGIVFFMLLGRVIQDKTYQSLSFERDFKSFFPLAVNKIVNNHIIPTTIDKIQVDDVIEIHHNELIPVDGICTIGKPTIDYSFVTGESMPVNLNIGDLIYAGGKQVDGKIQMLVVKTLNQSYLTELWNNSSDDSNKDTKYEDILSKYFTIVVLSIAALASLYWIFQGNYQKVFDVLTTILIIACPCALLLSASFTYGNVIRILGKHQFFVKNKLVIQNLAKVKSIVFDKTGTLTNLNKMQVNYNGLPLENNIKINISALVNQSNHPLSKAIKTYLKVEQFPQIKHYKNTDGKGIEAWIDEQYYKIGSASFVKAQDQIQSTAVYISIDNQYIGRFEIQQNYRSGLQQLIQQLQDKFQLAILSGDNNHEEQKLKKVFGKTTAMYFNQMPIDKQNYITTLQQTEPALFIGDGLNDAGALKTASVGIAITDNTNNFTPASDAILQADKLPLLYQLIKFSQQAQKVILGSFLISLIYNIIGISFAVQGKLSPIIAAIIMPISTVTIILFTFISTQILSSRIKEKHHS